MAIEESVSGMYYERQRQVNGSLKSGGYVEFHDVINDRHSVREYENESIPDVVLSRILESARLAPSASNRMPWKMVIVSDRQKREEIAKSGTYGKFLTQSPIAIVGLGDFETAPKWYAVDTTIALEHIVLAATAEGLGTCWIGSFDEAKVREIVGAPDSLRVVAIIALGLERKGLDLKGKAVRLIRRRKKLEELVSRERVETPWSSRSG